MKKNLAAEVATLSGVEASGFANRGELEADLGTLANHIRSRYLLSFGRRRRRRGRMGWRCGWWDTGAGGVGAE